MFSTSTSRFVPAFVLFWSCSAWAARQCPVGVGGDWAPGYTGVLARHGVPFEQVLDHQLRADQFLARYDALVISSVDDRLLPTLAAPVERYVRAGGQVLFESRRPLQKLASKDKVEGEEPFLVSYYARAGGVRQAKGTVVPEAKENPLAPEWAAPQRS